MFIRQDQRISYESIALTVEIMEFHLANLHAIARPRVAENPDNPAFTRTERAVLISSAWAIVDQADLLRQFIVAQGTEIDLAAARSFLEIASTVRDLRNWMDHLPQRIGNFIERRGALPPAHGALSFTYVEPEVANEAAKGEPLRQYRTIVILSTAMQREFKVEGEPYKYERFAAPIDHFVLQGFGHHLQLMELVRRATAFCDDFASRVNSFCQIKGAELASERGRPIEEIMKASELPAGVLVMTATLK